MDRGDEDSGAEEENSDKITIWWDLENIGVPNGFPPEKVYESILRRLRTDGFTGPVDITAIVAYADSPVPENLDQKIRVVRAMNFNRPPNSANDQTSDMEIKDSIGEWICKTKLPQNVLLITSDNGYGDCMENLSSAGHNVMLFYLRHPDEDRSAKIFTIANYICEWRSSVLNLPPGVSAKDRKLERQSLRKKTVEESRKKKREESRKKKKKMKEVARKKRKRAEAPAKKPDATAKPAAKDSSSEDESEDESDSATSL